MLPSRRLAVALAAVCAVSLSGCGKKELPGPLPEETNTYVALGDSFTAVAGRGSYSDYDCRRSKDDYPALVAAKEKFASFADVSCGGAKPEELTQAQKTSKATRQPQLNAVTAETKLITVGIGLNEELTGNGGSSQISYILTETCAPANEKDPACQAYLGAKDSEWAKVIDALSDKVGASLDQIRVRAPNARIVFVGYPRVLPDSGPCAKVDLPPVAFERLRTTLKVLNQKLKAIAARDHVEYVDMYTASAGHDACSADPWVNGSKPTKAASAYHPFAAYHQAVAAKIVALLKTKKPQA